MKSEILTSIVETVIMEIKGMGGSDEMVDYILNNFVHVSAIRPGLNTGNGRMTDLSVVNLIKTVVSEYYEVPWSAYQGKVSFDIDISSRSIGLRVEPRQVAMCMSLKYTQLSLADIGLLIGKKDHATVLHAKKRMKDLCSVDKSINLVFREIDTRLKDLGLKARRELWF